MTKKILLLTVLIAAFSFSAQYDCELKDFVENNKSGEDSFDVGDTLTLTELYLDGQVIRNEWQLENTEKAIALKKGKSNYTITKYYKEKDDECVIFTYPLIKTKAEGKVFGYFSNGKKCHDGFYKNGKPFGKATEYYPNGKKQSEFSYQNDEINGILTIFFPSGSIRSKVNMKNGTPSGVKTTYYESGKIRSTHNTRNGIWEGKTIFYWPNGKVAAELMFENNVSYEKTCYSSKGYKELLGCSIDDFLNKLESNEDE